MFVGDDAPNIRVTDRLLIFKDQHPLGAQHGGNGGDLIDASELLHRLFGIGEALT